MQTQSSGSVARVAAVAQREGRARSGKVVHLQTQASRATLVTSVSTAAISSFCFYYCGALSVYVFPRVFFANHTATLALLESLAVLALAYGARPVGAALLGHVGDRLGRKPALIAALVLSGLATMLIGMMPGYPTLGAAAPIALTVCRFMQGLALGGSWGGTLLLPFESGDMRHRELTSAGAPVGFLLAVGTVLLLGRLLGATAFLDWGWRLPLGAGAVLVCLAFYAGQRLAETKDFRGAAIGGARVRLPLLTLFARHSRALIFGTAAATGMFVLFYVATVFYLVAIYSLKWGGDLSDLEQGSTPFLLILMIGLTAMAICVPLSAAAAARFGRRAVLVAAALATFGFGWLVAPLIGSGSVGGMAGFCLVGLGVAGLYQGSLGPALVRLFPVPVRYTGVAVTLNLAGIIGALVTPWVTTSLVTEHGLPAVGAFVAGAALVSLTGVLLLRDF